MWPIVGNSYSPMTTLLRRSKLSALATALIAADALVTIATSSALAWMKPRIRGAGLRKSPPTRPKAQMTSANSPHMPHAAFHGVRKRALRTTIEVCLLSKDGKTRPQLHHLLVVR